MSNILFPNKAKFLQDYFIPVRERAYNFIASYLKLSKYLFMMKFPFLV